MKADKSKPTAFELDLRVRDRLIQANVLDPKLVERHMAELPDLEGQYESLPFQQPALSGNGQGDGR